jgi:hypothetical protein
MKIETVLLLYKFYANIWLGVLLMSAMPPCQANIIQQRKVAYTKSCITKTLLGLYINLYKGKFWAKENNIKLLRHCCVF